MTFRNQVNNLIYIALVGEGDIGPLQHIQAILKYSKKNIHFITNSLAHTESTTSYKIPYKVQKSIFKRQIYVIKFLNKLFKEAAFDSVLVRHSLGFIFPYVFIKLKKKELSLEVNGLIHQDLIDRKRNTLINSLNWLLEFVSYKLADKVILVHENLKSQLRTRYFIPKNKFYIIENGVDPLPSYSITIAKEKCGFNSSFCYIGYLGALATREGVDLLISYFEKLPGHYKLCLVGGVRSEFNELTKKLNIDNLTLSRITHIETTTRERALLYMSACNILVHLRRPIGKAANLSQGSPLKILDYLLLKRPILVSNVPSYDFISKKRFGENINCYSEYDFLSIIPKIKEKKYNLKEARQLILKKHSWEKQIYKLDKIL